MERTGGGFLKSGRMGGDLPDVTPMKPMGPVPAASPSAQQSPPPQGGMIGGQPPQGQPTPPQGQPQGMPTEQGMGDQINHVANNALMLLHDEEAGPAFDDMISQGPEGAAQAALQIYSQVRQGYEQAGQPIDEEMAGEATFAVLEDIAEIGMSTGALKGDEDIQAFSQQAFQLIGQQFPDVAEDMKALHAETAAEEGGQMPQGAPMPPQPQGGMLGVR